MAAEKKVLRKLTSDELKKLLSLVDKPDSDFDDSEEVMGWVNYDTREDVLTVTYESEETGQTWHADFELKLLYSALEDSDAGEYERTDAGDMIVDYEDPEEKA